MSLASRLDRRVTIERRTDAVDSFGGPLDTYAALATVAASVRETDGREFLAGDTQLVAEQRAVFTIRWRAIEPTDRIMYGGRAFDVQSTREVGRRAALEILAIARA